MRITEMVTGANLVHWARLCIRALTVVIVWFLICLVVLIGLPLGLGALAIMQTRYASRVMRMTNRTAATVFGWDGEHGISHQCGKSECLGCRLLCAALTWLLYEPEGHCKTQAQK
jgi:hypothetical protein